MSGEIYMITNVINNKKYIGQVKSRISGRKYGAKSRWSVHKYRSLKGVNCSRILGNAIRKYGIDNFTMEILLRCNEVDLDYYETKFIGSYNTQSPNGYNIESGGKKNKKMSRETKQILSNKTRFRYVSEENKNKIKALMEQLNLEKIPKGIQYSNDTVSNYEGFRVVYKNRIRSFCSKSRTLLEKFKLSLKYLDLLKENNPEKLNNFDKMIKKEASKLMSKSSRKLNENVINAMLECGIEEIPMYIRYEKRSNRFYVKLPNKSCKYFTKHEPSKSLKEAISYIDEQRVSVDNT